MNFLVDAQLPRRVCAILAQHGHNAIHTRELPTGNATKDSLINEISISEQRVVVSKDSDFFYSHVLHGRPWKLLLIKTGNLFCSNRMCLAGAEPVGHRDCARDAHTD